MEKGNYKIGQLSKPTDGNKYFDWEIWIDEPEEILKEINNVTYFLHQTFPKPIRKRTNRSEKFRMKASGWGTFMININIEKTDNSIVHQQHYLILGEYDSKTAPPPRSANFNVEVKQDIKENKKKIFLSYSAADKLIADKIKLSLEAKNCQVSVGNDVPPGADWQAYIKNEIEKADEVIQFESEFSSDWQNTEIQFAKSLNKHIRSIKSEDDLNDY